MMNAKKVMILVAAVMLTLCLMTGAYADRVYTSPGFHIPSDRITIIVTVDPTEQEPEITVQSEGAMTEETAGPAEGEAPDAEPTGEAEPEAEPVEGEIPETELPEGETTVEGSADQGEPETEPTEGDMPEAEPVEEGEPEIKQTEVKTPEAGEQVAEPTGEDEPAEETREDFPELTVKIRSNLRTQMTEGETVRLTCVVEGLAGRTATYQWQVDKGNGWQDVPDATDSILSFSADRETLAYNWRVIVEAETAE